MEKTMKWQIIATIESLKYHLDLEDKKISISDLELVIETCQENLLDGDFEAIFKEWLQEKPDF
jgi:hypothetical protein